MTDAKTADKTPNPISSEDAQTGAEKPVKGQTLGHPDPKTETVDKVLTPTSIKDTERQTDAINEQADKAERKLGH
ncbi:hypothetical protein [Pseudomonas synxantha]|uniref:Uncharacterized protein n=1 Tax=Pseudomonas synxantha TaxID=47883 RepID=A0AAX3I6N8_9PSED|nr:hypothetical protein [Pseudomonas synxantha]AZE67597.1 hypothetical protein C4K01_3404 [Pseudomonas synxantha]KRP49064.1 hypothetical protein TU77_25930 [Pseudomonas synxantha]MBI6564923.1 hypothetical protein [Pseudomonas synxantha]MBI6582249.1 hypothetical protein [Pseudomonas synxantha]MBI6644830.1 hypothetical protein [Pseudomonas synxantha]